MHLWVQGFFPSSWRTECLALCSAHSKYSGEAHQHPVKVQIFHPAGRKHALKGQTHDEISKSHTYCSTVLIFQKGDRVCSGNGSVRKHRKLREEPRQHQQEAQSAVAGTPFSPQSRNGHKPLYLLETEPPLPICGISQLYKLFNLFNFLTCMMEIIKGTNYKVDRDINELKYEKDIEQCLAPSRCWLLLSFDTQNLA